MYYCKNGFHPLRGPADRLSDGSCKGCHDARQASYRNRQKLALAILKQMESAGLTVHDLDPESGFAIGLEWANALSDRELERLERQHPVMVEKLRTRLARIDAG